LLTRRQILVVALSPILKAQGPVEIAFDGSAFRILGWRGIAPDQGWESVFSVYAGYSPDAPAMLGTYAVEDGALIFRPRFPVSPGVRTKAVLRVAGSEPVERVFQSHVSETKPIIAVQQVYPSGDTVPANLLRFYIQFSAPMERGRVWQYIQLLDRNDKPLDLPFLELDQELWDREGRRLTVLFDPGRIERGVLPRDEVGSALVEGSAYTLVIHSECRDANGVPLQRTFKKLFRVLPEVRQGIDLKTWRIQAPRVSSKDALIVDFPAPLDYALLHRLLEVRGRIERVNGGITVHREETQWRFVPYAAWTAGDYSLQIATTLEDVAGNRVGRPFDVDTFDAITSKITRRTESIPFRIGF
jgi:hypothetical protein